MVDIPLPGCERGQTDPGHLVSNVKAGVRFAGPPVYNLPPNSKTQENAITEHFGQIAFESQVGLVPQSEGEIVHNIEGQITVMVDSPDDEDTDDEDTDNDEADPEQPAGVVGFLVVPLAEIRRREMSLWEVCDADSGGLADVYDALPEEICESAESLLFVHALDIDERFQQPGFAPG